MDGQDRQGGRGRLTRKIGVVAAGRAANTASLIAIYALVARAWTAEECGLFMAVWVVGNALIPVFLLGLPTSLLYFFPRRSEPRLLVGQVLLCLAASGLILAGCLWLWGPQLADVLVQEGGDSEQVAAYLLPFLPYLFAVIAAGGAETALVAADREHYLAWLQLAMGGALVTGAGGALWLGWTPAQVLALFSGVGVLRLLAICGLVRLALGGGRWWEWEGLGELMRYTRPVGLNDAVGSLSRYVDRFVVMHFFAAGAFAEYNFGAIEVPISLLLSAVTAVLIPEVSRLFQEGQLDEILALWQRAVSRLALLVLPLAAFLLAFAGSLIGWLFPEYDRSAWVFRIYLLVLPLRCAAYSPLLVGMGKARWALWGSVGDLCCNIGLSLVLVSYLQAAHPAWAFLGPAVATTLVTYLQVAFLLVAIGWHLRCGWYRLMPWGRLLRIGAGAGAAAVVCRWVSADLGGDFLQVAVGGMCFVVLIGALTWAYPQDRAELTHTWRALTRMR